MLDNVYTGANHFVPCAVHDSHRRRAVSIVEVAARPMNRSHQMEKLIALYSETIEPIGCLLTSKVGLSTPQGDDGSDANQKVCFQISIVPPARVGKRRFE